jgi:hypothetical protein
VDFIGWWCVWRIRLLTHVSHELYHVARMIDKNLPGLIVCALLTQ